MTPKLVAANAFDRLTSSGLEFLERAASDLATVPKFAVVHLCSGIELLLKARLLAEHWSLVVSRPENATRQAFASGAFHSVSIEEALRRLRNIAGEPIAPHEERAFLQVRDHRNRVVHFVSDAYDAAPSPEALAELAREQCTVWVHLRRLVFERWQSQFADFVPRFRALETSVRNNRAYLQGAFDAVSPSIADQVRKGDRIVLCESCGFKSAAIANIVGPIRWASCAVCQHRRSFAEEKCPQCGDEVQIADGGQGRCSSCGWRSSLDWLVGRWEPDDDPKDEEPRTAYCRSCGCTECHSVVPIEDGLYCLSCFEEHGHLGHCGWCQERVTGDLEHSYLIGCMLCSGRMGSDGD